VCPLMFHCDRQGQKIGLGGHGADFVVLSDALIMKIAVRQTVLLSKFYFCFFPHDEHQNCCQSPDQREVLVYMSFGFTPMAPVYVHIVISRTLAER